MNIGAWLPQVLALLPSLGVASISLFANRKKRVMAELDTLLDLRERCDDESLAGQRLDRAIESVAKKLSETMRQRLDSSSLVAMVIVAVIVFCAMYPAWLWVFQNGEWYTWLVALPLTIVSVVFLAAGATTIFKSEEEIEEAARKRVEKKRATKTAA
ncbi:hypothetical protein [Enteractinococcus helveticum]|nr:hypothetical protein [Enteractinococcus helveticum]